MTAIDPTTSATDPATDPTVTDPATTTTDPADPKLGEAGEKALASFKDRARIAERDLKAAKTELEKARTANMSEQEKAVAAAKLEGRTEAMREAGRLLVDAEVRAAAAGRNVNVDALIDGLDRTRFMNDDGAADRKAIVGWLDKVAPKNQKLDLGQGARTQGGSDMNTLIRAKMRG